MTLPEMPPYPHVSKLFEDDNNIVLGYKNADLHSYASQYGQLCADQARAEERERNKLAHVMRIVIPTDAMEQEINAHVRRAVAADRERCAKLLDAAASKLDPGLKRVAQADRHTADVLRSFAAAIRKGEA